jgi:hypothetical protein
MVKGRNEPVAIAQVAHVIAGVKGITVEEVCEAWVFFPSTDNSTANSHSSVRGPIRSRCSGWEKMLLSSFLKASTPAAFSATLVDYLVPSLWMKMERAIYFFGCIDLDQGQNFTTKQKEFRSKTLKC